MRTPNFKCRYMMRIYAFQESIPACSAETLLYHPFKACIRLCTDLTLKNMSQKVYGLSNKWEFYMWECAGLPFCLNVLTHREICAFYRHHQSDSTRTSYFIKSKNETGSWYTVWLKLEVLLLWLSWKPYCRIISLKDWEKISVAFSDATLILRLWIVLMS